MTFRFYKNALLTFTFAAVSFGFTPAQAELHAYNPDTEIEIVMPFTLNLFEKSYKRESSVNSLANIEPAAGGNDVDSFNAGGIALGMTEETSKKGDATVVKLELSYSPIDKMKIKTRRGGLMMVKKFVFEPKRNVITTQDAPPPPFWDGKAD